MIDNTILQQRCINKLNKLKVGAIFAAMGTGKTKMALDLMAYKKKADYLLWLCPCSLEGAIEEEHQKWHPELNLHVVGIESIGSSDRTYVALIEELEKQHCIFCVVDESLKIKNADAKRTRRILSLAQKCEYKLILNGTPLTNNVLDVYTQFQFLSPLILPESFREFKDKYCVYYACGVREGMVKAQCNIDNLISRVKPYIFDAELDIGAVKKYEKVCYMLNDKELELYEETKDDYLNIVGSDSEISFYTLTTKLQWVLTQSEERSRALEQACKGKGKTVCFVKFICSIPQGARCIIGDMSVDERMKTIEEFKRAEGDQVLYITYGCGAFGLNLQFCSHMVFLDRTWDYAMMKQAEARIYRMGQNKDVTYTTLIASCIGLEDMISRNLERKTDMLKEVKRSISTLSEEEKKKWLKTHL